MGEVVGLQGPEGVEFGLEGAKAREERCVEEEVGELLVQDGKVLLRCG